MTPEEDKEEKLRQEMEQEKHAMTIAMQNAVTPSEIQLANMQSMLKDCLARYAGAPPEQALVHLAVRHVAMVASLEAHTRLTNVEVGNRILAQTVAGAQIWEGALTDHLNKLKREHDQDNAANAEGSPEGELEVLEPTDGEPDEPKDE